MSSPFLEGLKQGGAIGANAFANARRDELLGLQIDEIRDRNAANKAAGDTFKTAQGLQHDAGRAAKGLGANVGDYPAQYTNADPEFVTSNYGEVGAPGAAPTPGWARGRAMMDVANVYAQRGMMNEARTAMQTADEWTKSHYQRVSDDAMRALNARDYKRVGQIYGTEVPDGMFGEVTETPDGRFNMTFRKPDGSMETKNVDRSELDGMLKAIADPANYRRFVLEGRTAEMNGRMTAIEHVFRGGNVKDVQEWLPGAARVDVVDGEIKLEDGRTAKVAERVIVDAKGNVLLRQNDFEKADPNQKIQFASRFATEAVTRQTAVQDSASRARSADASVTSANAAMKNANTNEAWLNLQREMASLKTVGMPAYDEGEGLEFYQKFFKDTSVPDPHNPKRMLGAADLAIVATATEQAAHYGRVPLSKQEIAKAAMEGRIAMDPRSVRVDPATGARVTGPAIIITSRDGTPPRIIPAGQWRAQTGSPQIARDPKALGLPTKPPVLPIQEAPVSIPNYLGLPRPTSPTESEIEKRQRTGGLPVHQR